MKAGIDIYTGIETIQALGLEGHRVKVVEPLKQFTIGDFEIIGLPIEHDVEGLAFLIRYKPTGYKILFATDTYYLKYKFKNLNGIAVECNYIKETLDQNIADGYIDEASKPRLLKSHFSLENVKDFLRANDLSSCTEILLLHLSSSNSNATQMIKEIEELTGITPKIAREGLEVELSEFPY